MFGNKAPFGTTTSFSSSTFGSASPFGQNTSAFGGNKQLGSGFGSSAFGAAPPNTSIFSGAGTSGGSIFGSSNFGQPSTSSTFGATSGSGLFNTQPSTGSALFQAPSTSAFGAPKPSFGGFGNTASTGLFSQNTQSSSLFNQTAPTGTGLFGSSGSSFPTAFGSATSGQSGTAVKFNPVTGTDTMMKNGVTTNISIRHQCITVMKDYEVKSLEELRTEDYLSNRKGPQQTGMSTFGGAQPSVFGGTAAATPSTGLFQNQNKSLFGAANTFGGTTPGSTVFGQPMHQQNTGLFGAPKPVGFGAATTTASSFNFGSASGVTPFGSTNTAQNKSLFGTTTTQTAGPGLFGATNTLQQPSTTFGSAPFNAGAFGAPNQSSAGLFGNKGAFGTAATTSTSSFSFGNPANTSVTSTPFAPKPAVGFASTGFGGSGSTFGGFGTGPSLFSQNKPATSFGNTGTTGFGSGLGGLGTSGGSLFGGTANKPGGLSLGTGFGANANTGFGTNNNLALMGTSFNMASQNNVLGSDQSIAQLAQQQTQAQQQLLALAQSPFGDSPLFRNMLQDSGKREDILKPTNPAAQKALANNTQYKISPRPSAKAKPKPLHVIMNGKASLFDGFDEDDVEESTKAFVPRKSIKKLSLKPKSPSQLNKSSVVPVTGMLFSPDVIPSTKTTTNLNKSPILLPLNKNSLEHCVGDVIIEPLEKPNSQNPSPENIINKFYTNPIARPVPELNAKRTVPLDDTIAALNIKNKQVVSENDDSEKENLSQDLSSDGSLDNDSEPELVDSAESHSPHPAGVVLRRAGYYTIPPLEEIAQLVDNNGDCFVENFTVGREGFGNVFFFGVTNVAGLNLDEIVHFRKKEVTVYPDDDNKPPLGEGLNRRAQVTLDGVWPVDKTTCKAIKSPDRLQAMHYQEKLESVSAKLNAKFVDYRPETGSWVFQVSHFSKYGLEDSDEDDVPPKQIKKLKTLPDQLSQQTPEPPNSMQQQIQKPQQSAVENASRSGEEPVLNGVDHQPPSQFPHVGDEDDEMEDVTRQTLQSDYYSDEVSGDSEELFEPPSHRLAMALGVNSQRMQVMKASLFADPLIDGGEDMDYKESSKLINTNLLSTSRFNESIRKASELPNPIRLVESECFVVQPSNTMYYTPGGDVTPPLDAAESEMTTFEYPLKPPPQPPEFEPDFSKCIVLPTSFQPTARPQRTVSMGRLRKLVPFSHSRLRGCQNLIADTACLMGRRFRVGWGPDWNLVHCGKTIHADGYINSERKSEQHLFLPYLGFSKPKSRLESASFTVTIERVDCEMTTGIPEGENRLVDLDQCLEIQLSNSKCAMENGCPIIVPTPGVMTLHQQSELARNLINNIPATHPDLPFLEHWKQVWDLCVALWGHIPGYDAETESGNTHAHRMARRSVFSEWLQSATSRAMRDEMLGKNADVDAHITSIFSFLSCCQVSQACNLAQQSSDHRLALLLAQAGSSVEFRQMLQKQLENWEELKADKFISHERLKVYALLAGSLVWPSSLGAVNTCENLDWKRALGVHLWYSCSRVASISDALQEYKAAFKGNNPFGKYAHPPLPHYMEVDGPNVHLGEMDNGRFPAYDVCYHLLRLYVKRSHRLDRVLCPSTMASDPLDNRLSWLLYQSLLAVGYDHLSEYTANSLHTNFAAQLEALGQWRWAIFVVLHVSNPHRRYTLTMNILSRHIILQEDPEVEEFLHNKLLIPKEWICQAKACRARYDNKPKDEAWYLLKAGSWSQSHDIILQHIASDAIINESYDYINNYLVELARPDRSSTIRNWSVGGQVFLDYIHMSQTLDKVVTGKMGPYELEHLQPQVMSLCDRVGSIQCRTAKDRLCQSEMAKKTANLLRAVLSLQTGGGPIPSHLLAPHLSNLPLPEDYTLQELRSLKQSYLLEITS